jgi:hypothetical protein
MNRLRQFAASSNGDRWFLGRDDKTREAFVLHRGNAPSGGHETRTAVPAFLNLKPVGPERDALIAALGVSDDWAEEAQDSYTSSSL